MKPRILGPSGTPLPTREPPVEQDIEGEWVVGAAVHQENGSLALLALCKVYVDGQEQQIQVTVAEPPVTSLKILLDTIRAAEGQAREDGKTFTQSEVAQVAQSVSAQRAKLALREFVK